ncbi:hypothetical protein J4410_02210 [Candidatus Woesearchaeota archaeon]|nr:hypothetical protein [Candidatus Woesearchaeota archaeon]
MDDISLLLLKPEVVKKEKEIQQYLEKKGYTILRKKKFSSWVSFVKKKYGEFSNEEREVYLSGYQKNKWGTTFIVFVLQHRQGDTLSILRRDLGHFIGYQDTHEDSLRAKFGQGQKKNMIQGKITFAYNGFHCPQDEEELQEDFEILGMNLS